MHVYSISLEIFETMRCITEKQNHIQLPPQQTPAKGDFNSTTRYIYNHGHNRPPYW